MEIIRHQLWKYSKRIKQTLVHVLGGEIMDDDIVKIIKDTLEIIKILNEQKKDYIHSLLKVCICLIISFTVIICCFYALYFTM